MDSQRLAGLPIELTCIAQLRNWLTLQPSLQYVIKPDTDPQLRNATAALLRFSITLKLCCLMHSS